ncbi:unnamed protein product [Closterium sp. NIES-54]
MGHVALPILQQVKNEIVAGIRLKEEPDEVLGCPTCMQAKFTRYPFSSSEATVKAPLDEVVMDVVGPLKLGAAREENFLTIVDVYTCMTWVYVLSKKSDVAEMVKTDWLPMKNGIRHSLAMPYSPAMNDIAERANRTITETALRLLIEAGLPDYFWPDAVRSACVAKNRALTHVGADKWVPYVEWIGRKPKVDMLRVFGCMCMALVPKHLRHNKLSAKAIWAVHLSMSQNRKGWLLSNPFTKKFLVSRDCKFIENLMYKDWKAENEAKIGMRFGEVKSSGLEHVELPLDMSSGSTTTRQSSLVNGGEEAKDAEEEEEELQQVSERALTLPSRTTSAPRIRVTPQQRHESLHVPAAEEEGRGKRRIQAPNRLTYEALGKPAKSALAKAAMMVGDDKESEYEEFAFAFFSPVEMPGEPATLKEALESSDAEDWKKAMESELKGIEENGMWEWVELPEGRKAITSKWLFKIKSDTNGRIEHYKSRLVAKGYQQKEKVEYKELYAPVVRPTTLQTLLGGAAIKGWVVKQMDVTTTFLNGILEEEIFMSRGGVAATVAAAAALSVGALGESRGGVTAAAAPAQGAAAAVSVGASGESRGGVTAAAAAFSVGASGEIRGVTAAAAAAAVSVGASGESRGGVAATAAVAAVSVGALGESRGGVTAAVAPVQAAAAAAVSVGASRESRGGVTAAAAAVLVGASGESRGVTAAIAAAAVSVGASKESRGGVTNTVAGGVAATVGEGRGGVSSAAAGGVAVAPGEGRAGAPPAAARAGTVAADARGGGAAATATARPARPSTCTLEPRRSRYRADGPFHLVLRSRVPSPPVLPQPLESTLTVLHDPLSDYLRASCLVVFHVLSALVTHPTAPLSSVSALITTIAGFASSHRLDYAAHLVSGPAHSPSFGGAPVFPLEVLEDRQFELGFLAAAVPHLCAILLAPEGDPDALDIPIPRSLIEAVSGPWASYWIAAQEAEMAS